MGGSQPNKEDEGKTMTVEKKMKKKIFRMPQDRLDYYLSFEATPVRRSTALRNPVAAAELDKLIEEIQAEQEKMRREYEAKGYVTFEADVTDDEEGEDAAAPCIIQQGEEKEEDILTSPCITPQGDEGLAAPWFIPRRGRRRFRPGVVKQATASPAIAGPSPRRPWRSLPFPLRHRCCWLRPMPPPPHPSPPPAAVLGLLPVAPADRRCRPRLPMPLPAATSPAGLFLRRPPHGRPLPPSTPARSAPSSVDPDAAGLSSVDPSAALPLPPSTPARPAPSSVDPGVTGPFHHRPRRGQPILRRPPRGRPLPPSNPRRLSLPLSIPAWPARPRLCSEGHHKQPHAADLRVDASLH